jgi:hypothetical protein
MSLALLLVLLLLPGLAGALMSRPFEPTARLAPLRWLVTTGASAVGAALLVSLAQDWWVVDDYEREQVLLTEGTSGFPIVVVSVGLVACLLVVLAAWGRRNWPPLAFTFLWLLLAVAWWSSTGEPVDSDAGGRALPGLELASWATLAGTVVTVLGSFSRFAERASAPAASAG